jgi:hypothetical protein
MLETADHLAHELRAAVLASDHENAARLSVQYSAALQEHWMTLSAGERAASSLPTQSLELLNWVREMTLMQRALTAQHLGAIERASRYQTARALYLQSAVAETR